MGQKTHPLGFRLGITKDWRVHWFAQRDYSTLLKEDMDIRQAIQDKYPEADISRVAIERQAHEVSVTIHTAKPGLVIGRQGQRVDELRANLESLTGKKVKLNVQEIREPELDAYLVARMVASQLQRRVAYRRAVKQTATRVLGRGAQGVKITIGGRLGGAELARRLTERSGRMPLHTLRADIDYGFTEAHTLLGCIGIKVWIYRGDLLPQRQEAMGLPSPPSPHSPGLEEVRAST